MRYKVYGVGRIRWGIKMRKWWWFRWRIYPGYRPYISFTEQGAKEHIERVKNKKLKKRL